MNTPDSLFENSQPPELGFNPPQHRPLGEERHGAALASLVASVALVVAMLLVMSVSFGVTKTGGMDAPLQQSSQNSLAGSLRG